MNNKDPRVKKLLDYERAIVYYEREALVHPSKKKILLNNKREIEYKLALLNKSLTQKYPTLKSFNSVSKSEMKAALNRLSPQATFLEFFCGEDNLYSIIVEKGKISNIRQLSRATKIRSDIKAIVQTYFKNGAAAMINNPKGFFKESYSLYRDLLGGVKPGRNLIIVPDEEIGLLPFEALVTSATYSASVKNWQFLINKHIISYAYSLNTLLEPGAKTASTIKFEGFFISSTLKEGEIPAVKLEADKIQSRVKGSFFINQNATAANFRDALGKANLLHISTHSFMYGEQQEPALQLADQKFFLLELAAQTHAPDLVVLSACRTADGVIASGEGVLSLSRGFTAAGTKGIISGLWNVNDETGAEIISDFYENLRNGHSTDEALYLAKKKWLQGDHGNNSMLLPYYWASLVYIGKPQILKIEEDGHKIQDWALAFGTTITAALIYYTMRRRSSSRKRN